MNKVHIEMKNCYGINKLVADFDFSNKSTYVIYAPNGTMKTSFAKTMLDLTLDKVSHDLIFPERDTVRVVVDETSTPISSEKVFVIEPYNEKYKSDKLSTLLVNQDLRNKYEETHNSIAEKKITLVNDLKTFSGLKKGIEEEISEAFYHTPNEFYKALMRAKYDVQDKEEAEFSNILYSKIFTSKVIGFLGNPEFQQNINDYINKYNDLINSSTYFKKGIFNHNNAAVIAKNLKDNGFFKANHSVSLNGSGESVEIKTEAELETVINEEKNLILNNPDLLKEFDTIDAKLKANKELRDFRDYLIANINILPELKNLDLFKAKLWISYFKECKASYEMLVNEYESGKETIEEIISEAKSEETDWRLVIGIFNRRFDVPFKLSVENQDDVILKSDGPSIKFTFNESESSQHITEEDLLKVLSNGEKRALYILNIIFEVEARKKRSQETLFIIDDIADSFDYKNKYAIIEYLKDISLYEKFNQIILSHNFDFFRTVCSRLDMKREHKLHTIKSDNEIKLIEEKYQKNPFNEWRKNLGTNNCMLIASIPFVRNIAEYSGDTSSFEKLTSLLHVKSDTLTLTVAELELIHKGVLKDQSSLNLNNGSALVLDLIIEEADRVALANEEVIDLEGKVVISMAIRLLAEKHMINKIADAEFVNGITSNQTYKLVKKYSEVHETEVGDIELLNQVNLMTPENIHLNSFMYEPILDMSNTALVRLYNDVKKFELSE